MSYEEDSLSESGGHAVTVDEGTLDEDTLQVLDYLGILKKGPDGRSCILWDPRLISHKQLVDADVPFVDLFDNLIRNKRLFIPDFLERVLGDVARRYPSFSHLLDVPQHLRDPNQEAKEIAIQMEIDQAIIGQLLHHVLISRMDPRTGALSHQDFEDRVMHWMKEVVIATEGISLEDSGVLGSGIYYPEQGLMTLIRVHNPEAPSRHLLTFAHPEQATSQLLQELELTQAYGGVAAYQGDKERPNDFYYLTSGDSVDKTVESLQMAVAALDPIPGLGVKPLVSGVVVSFSEMMRLANLLSQSGVYWRADELYEIIFKMWTLVMKRLLKYVSAVELVEHIAHLHITSPSTFDSMREDLELGAVNPDHVIKILEQNGVIERGQPIPLKIFHQLQEYAGLVFHLTHADDRMVIESRLARVRDARTRDTRVLELKKLCTDYAAMRWYRHMQVRESTEFVENLFSDPEFQMISDSIDSIERLGPRVDAVRQEMRDKENRQLGDGSSSLDLPPVISPPDTGLVLDASPPRAVLTSSGPSVGSDSKGTFDDMSFEISEESDSSDSGSKSGDSGGGGDEPSPTSLPSENIESVSDRMTEADDSLPELEYRNTDGFHEPDTWNGQSDTERTIDDPGVGDSDSHSIPSSASLKTLREREREVDGVDDCDPGTVEYEDSSDFTPPPIHLNVSEDFPMSTGENEVPAPVRIEDTPAEQSEWSEHGSKSEFNVQPVGPVYESDDDEDSSVDADTEVSVSEPSFHDPDGDIEVECEDDTRDRSISRPQPEGLLEARVDSDGSFPSLDPPKGRFKRKVHTGDFDRTPAVTMPAIGTSRDDDSINEHTEPSGVHPLRAAPPTDDLFKGPGSD